MTGWVVQDLLFYGFAAFALLSGTMVVVEKNPVHAVFFLIVAFCNGAGMLLCMGVEFLAFHFLIVYVGAIAVLFLFIVMMLNVNAEESKAPYVPLFFLFATLWVVELFWVAPSFPVFDWYSFGDLWSSTNLWSKESIHTNWMRMETPMTNLEGVGLYLYTSGVLYFILSGFLLLVAMIGAIALTLHRRENVKRQEIHVQMARDADQILRLRRVSS